MAKDNTEIIDADFPPLSPDGEKRAPVNSSFENTCLAMLDKIRALGNIQAGHHSLTLNNTWGILQ
jgi:hypothetical protein